MINTLKELQAQEKSHFGLVEAIDAKVATSIAVTNSTLQKQQAALETLLAQHCSGRKFEELHEQVTALEATTVKGNGEQIMALEGQEGALSQATEEIRAGRRDIASRQLQIDIKTASADALGISKEKLAAQRTFLADTIAEAIAKNASKEVGALLQDALSHIQKGEAFHTSSIQEQKSQLSQAREHLLGQKATHEAAMTQYITDSDSSSKIATEEQKDALKKNHAHLVTTAAQLQTATIDNVHMASLNGAMAVLKEANSTTGGELQGQKGNLQQTTDAHATESSTQKDKQIKLLAANTESVDSSIKDQLAILQSHKSALGVTLQQQKDAHQSLFKHMMETMESTLQERLNGLEQQLTEKVNHQTLSLKKKI
jgi:hypothetical protein